MCFTYLCGISKIDFVTESLQSKVFVTQKKTPTKHELIERKDIIFVS